MNAAPAAAAAGTSIVRIRDLVKEYRRGAETVRVLDGLSLDIQQGDFVALMGPSGSGKSTLLNLIGGLDRPTSGTLEVEGLRVDRAVGRLAWPLARRPRRVHLPDVQPAAGAHAPSATSNCRCCSPTSIASSA